MYVFLLMLSVYDKNQIGYNIFEIILPQNPYIPRTFEHSISYTYYVYQHVELTSMLRRQVNV